MQKVEAIWSKLWKWLA